jgi:hypothetical protein
MRPFLPEPESLVPSDSARLVLDVENGYNLLAHAAEITARVGKGRVAWASVRECPLRRGFSIATSGLKCGPWQRAYIYRSLNRRVR